MPIGTTPVTLTRRIQSSLTGNTGVEMRCVLVAVVLMTSLPLTFAATPKSQQPQNVNVQSIQDPRGSDKVPFIVHENDSPRTPEEAQREIAKNQNEIAKDRKETVLHRWEVGIGI